MMLSAYSTHTVDREEIPKKQPTLVMKSSAPTPSPAIRFSLLGSKRNSKYSFSCVIPFTRQTSITIGPLRRSSGMRNNTKLDEKDSQKKNYPVNNSQEKEIKKKIPKVERLVSEKCENELKDNHKDNEPLKDVEEISEELYREDPDGRNAVIEDTNNMEGAPLPSSSVELRACPSWTPDTPSGATPPSLPNDPTSPITSLGFQMDGVAFSIAANQTETQMQYNQLNMNLGPGMGLPVPMFMGTDRNLPATATVKIHPPSIPVTIPPPADPSTSAFGYPMIETAVDPNLFSAQQKALQHKFKEFRGIHVLRWYFGNNNCPSADTFLEISEKSELDLMVIKGWFKDTLVSERKRSKESSSNFNNLPSASLNLEEYIKYVTPLIYKSVYDTNINENQIADKEETPHNDNEEYIDSSEFCSENLESNGTPTPSCSASGKRADCSGLPDYRIKALQENLENNHKTSSPSTPAILTSNIPVATQQPSKNSPLYNNQTSDLYRDHQSVPIMNPTIFPSYQTASPPVLRHDFSLGMGRKLMDDENDHIEHPRRKRRKTTILPNYYSNDVCQQYGSGSDPNTMMSQNTALIVGQRPDLVQGQFYPDLQIPFTVCPLCSSIFLRKCRLDEHLILVHGR